MRFQFNARTVMPSTGGAEKWPDGNYPLIIVGAEGKAIKTGDTTGSRMVFEVQCIDGPMKGKKNYIGLNLEHNNETTKRIAWEQLSAISWVVGKPDMNQTEDLYNIPFVAYATASERGNNWNNFKTINGENALDVYNRVAAGGPIFPQGQPAQQQGGFQPQQGGFAPPNANPNVPPQAQPGGFNPQQAQAQPAQQGGGWATGPGASGGGFQPPNGGGNPPPAQGGGWQTGGQQGGGQGGGFSPPAQGQPGGQPPAGGGWGAGGPAPSAQPGWTQ